MTVMIGVGGIVAEAVADVTFRLVPIEPLDAEEMIDDLATQALLGQFREPAVVTVADVLLGFRCRRDRTRPRVGRSQPLIIVDGRPVAVDALVGGPRSAKLPPVAKDGSSRCSTARGRGGRCVHAPRQFGFVSPPQHPGLRLRGKVFATNRDGAEVLGVRAWPRSRSAGRRDRPGLRVHAGGSQCRPARACAKGSGPPSAPPRATAKPEEGRQAEAELVALADDLGILLPDRTEGVVSTPVVAVRPDRGAVPAPRPHRHRQPVGQLRSRRS